MAPESERAKKCKWCDKPIHKVRRYNSAGNEYFEQWAHELDDDATCTIMVEPSEPTLTCSEVVERLVKAEVLPDFEWNRTEATAILHSWRERRVQELEEAVKAVYYAAHWTPDRECDADKLWTNLRDAARLVPGQAPKPKVECICGGQESAKIGLPRLGILCPACDRTSGECP